MARANGKMKQKYAKLKKWPKITFRGPILVPEVAFWGFWELVCIEKWSQNFDWGTRSAIFDTPKMAKMPRFSHFEGIKNGMIPESKFRDQFSIQTSPKKPPQEPKLALKNAKKAKTFKAPNG